MIDYNKENITIILHCFFVDSVRVTSSMKYIVKSSIPNFEFFMWLLEIFKLKMTQTVFIFLLSGSSVAL